jgi:hypothetical protein
MASTHVEDPHETDQRSEIRSDGVKDTQSWRGLYRQGSYIYEGNSFATQE